MSSISKPSGTVRVLFSNLNWAAGANAPENKNTPPRSATSEERDPIIFTTKGSKLPLRAVCKSWRAMLTLPHKCNESIGYWHDPFPLTPALIGLPKVIHHRRGELADFSPEPVVNNFCAVKVFTCEQAVFGVPKRRHAELGERMTPPLSKDALGETFAPSSALWTKTNSQRSRFRRPSIRPSRVQSLA